MASSREFERFAGIVASGQGLKRRSIRSALVSASTTALDFVLRFVSIAVLARLLAPEHFGLVAMVAALTSILDGFRDFGLAAATVQRPDLTHQVVSNLFWVNALAGTAITLAFWGAAPLIAAYYNEPRLVMITVALALAFAVGGVSVQHEALLSRQLRQGELSVIRSVASLVSVVVAIVLAASGWDYWALVVREVLRTALTTVLVWVLCPWVPSWPARGAGTRRMLRFGADLSATHLLIALISNVDRILIGKYFGAATLGFYRQAQMLLIVPLEHLNQPIVGVAQPALSALQREPERYRRYYEKIVLLVALTTLPLGVFIAIYAYEVTMVVLGPAWIDAAVFVRIFGIAAAIRPTLATSAVVLISSGHSGRYLVTAVMHSFVLLVFMLVALRWGATAIAVAQVATTVVLLWPKLYYSFARTPVSVPSFFGAIRIPMIATACMTMGIIAVREIGTGDSTIVALVAGTLVGGILYLVSTMAQPGGMAMWRSLAGDVRAALARQG